MAKCKALTGSAVNGLMSYYAIVYSQYPAYHGMVTDVPELADIKLHTERGIISRHIKR